MTVMARYASVVRDGERVSPIDQEIRMTRITPDAETAWRPLVTKALAQLDLAPGLVGPRGCARIVETLAARADVWQDLVRHDPVNRFYLQLHYNPDFEVWLLGWEVGQDTTIHDHGGSDCAFQVTQGTLTEDCGTLREGGPLATRQRPTGTRRCFDADYVHNLGNAGPGVATSIHAYSPPLEAMNYYHQERDGRLVRVDRWAVNGPDPGVGEPRPRPAEASRDDRMLASV